MDASEEVACPPAHLGWVGSENVEDETGWDDGDQYECDVYGYHCGFRAARS